MNDHLKYHLAAQPLPDVRDYQGGPDPELQMLAEFDEHLDALEREHGIRLDDDARARILEQSIEHGFTEEATERVVTAHVTGEPVAPLPAGVMRLLGDLGSDLDDLEAKLGRPLLATEREAILGRTVKTVQRHGTFTGADVEQMLDAHYAETGEEKPDTDTFNGMTKFMVQRMREMDPPKPIDRDLDLDKHEDMVAYQMARLEGVEFDDVASDDDAVDDDKDPVDMNLQELNRHMTARLLQEQEEAD